MNKNILFIAYEFPPLNAGGVHRSLAFAKYLKNYGITPIIVTLSDNSYYKVYENPVIDHKLGKEVLSENDVIRIESKEITTKKKSKLRNFLEIYLNISGKESKGWRADFKEKIPDIVKKFKPEIVFVTVPPFSVLKEALWVANTFNLPLVIDFRDAWSQWRISPYASIFHYKATVREEGKYLRQANAVIATSKQTLDDFKRIHPSVNEKKFHLISNGYDSNISDWKIDTKKKEEYVIGYVGSFYYEPEPNKLMLTPWWKKRFHRIFQYIQAKQNWLYRSPYFFFKILRNLFDQDPQFADIIKVKLAGKKPSWIDQMVKEFELEKNVEFIGILSHQESLNFQKSCDALLITSAKVIGGKDYSIAGKTFEYFTMRKPIIAFVCEGAQKNILENSGMAIICDPDNINESSLKLRDLCEYKINLSPDGSFLNSLSRQNLTEKLAGLIRDIIFKTK